MFGEDFKTLDRITKFRLINSFIVTVLLSALITPIIMLQGLYMLPVMISVMAIMSTLAVKTNKFMVNRYSLDQMYKRGIIVQILYVFALLGFYFIPEITIYIISILTVLEIIIFSSFSIKLNVYITKFYPENVETYQILRNSIVADAKILGLIYSALFIGFGVGFIFYSTAFFHMIFTIWLIKNYNMYKGIEI